MVSNKIHTAFWRGYSSALSLHPEHPASAKRFIYKGRNLSGFTTAEAIRADWSMVAYHLKSAVEEAEQSERRPERRGSC